MGDHGRGNQSVAVLHQRMAQVAQLRFLAIALLVQPRIGIRRGLVRLVAALLAMEVGPITVSGIILGAETLLRGPGLDQRAIHSEVLVRHKLLRLPVHFGEEPLRYLGGQQTVAVLRKHRVIPHCIIHAQAHKPAKEQVVVDLLDQQTLGADGRRIPATAALAECTPAQSTAAQSPRTARPTPDSACAVRCRSPCALRATDDLKALAAATTHN